MRRHLQYGFWIVLACIAGVLLFSVSAGLGAFMAEEVGSHFNGAKAATSVKGALAEASSSAELASIDSDDAVASDISNSSLYSLKAPTSTLRVTAKAYLIGDVTTGAIIAEKNGTTIYPIASVSKLMTALIAKENENMQDIATISAFDVATYGTEGGLVTGEKLKVNDIFYPLLLVSSNDAAEALAEHYGRPAFLTLMNQKAASLGMINTHYEDPSGLTPKNVSTVEDLFKLSRNVYTAMPSIYDIARVEEYHILHHDWINNNHFLALSSFVGGKNGFTDEAQQTTVSLFSVPLGSAEGGNGSKHIIAIVLLHSTNREGDVATILNYINHNVTLAATTSVPSTN